MLETLRVKNLAIVENVRVEFGKGLNVITGETGAGKSILVGALGLVLGGRADRGMIRAGEDQCGVEASFQLPDPEGVNAVLENLGLQPCEDGTLVIRRIIAATGSGKILVNDSAATVQALKQIGDLLLDMHGPHDHQSLLSEDFQLDILDSFGHLWKERDTYAKAYRTMIDLEARRNTLDGDDHDVAQRIDMLTFQVKEIEDAELGDTDEDELQKEHTTVANAQRILELADGAVTALTGDEASAFNGLTAARTCLNEIADLFEEGEEWRDEAESLVIQAQELSSSITSAAGGIEGDPARLQWIEDRVAALHKLKRKYGESVAELLAFCDQAWQKLGDLQSRGEKIAEIEKQLQGVKKKVRSTGSALGKARRTAAGTLAEAITGELRDLGFAHGAFNVTIEEAEPRPSGTDEIAFAFAPNVGEPMRPLRAIASSGEISRVMLAVKSVLAAHDRIPVLVFDEIDTNVGGEMGNAIGEKLSHVADRHQVLCITHLPQVAVHGSRHFGVAKEGRDDRTHTLIRPLGAEERTEEIARMLGGRDLTSVTLKHAKEMLGNV